MARQYVTVDLFYDGAWNDHTEVYTRDPITISHGRGPEQGEPTPSSATLTFKGHDCNPENPASDLYGKIGLNTPIRIGAGPISGLDLPGGSGNYASSPDAAALDITGDIDIRAHVAPDDWTPGADMAIVSKSNTTGNQRSYQLVLQSAGNLRFTWSTDGTGAGTTDVNSTAATGFTNGTAHWVRATLAVATGTVTFYTSEDGSSWTQLGTPVVSGATSIFAGTATANVGARSAGTADLFAGQIYQAQILSGIDGTPVADPRFDRVEAGTTSFTDSAGRVWTVNGTAAVVAVPDNIRFCGEVADWRPRRAPGGDRWVEVEAGGLLRREDRGEVPTLSPWHRTTLSAETIDDLIAYWPCEDGQDSTGAASALPNVAPMSATGTVEFAASQDTFNRNMSALGFGLSVPPGTNPLANLAGGGKLSGIVPPSPTAASDWQWTVAFVAQTNAQQAGEDIIIARWFTPNGTYVRWDLVQLSSGLGTELYGYADAQGGGSALLATTINSEVVLTEYQIVAFQNSTNTQVELYIGGNSEDVTNFVTTTNTQVTRIELNPASNSVSGVSGFWVGHPKVWDTATPPSLGYSNFNQVTQETDADGVDVFPWFGWLNERAADRLDRVCREKGLPFLLTGDRTDTDRMGPQPTETFAGLLADVERTDAGLAYDAREQVALRYRTRVNLYNQTAVTLDVDAGGEVAPPLEPVIGDLGARNDVTVERRDGSTYRAVQETGPRNVQRPEDDPEGIGRYAAKVDVNPVGDGDLVGLGDWYRNRGTIKAVRYPQVTVKFGALAADDKTALAASVNALAIGDRVDLNNAEPTGVMQLVPGYAETIGPTVAEREITLNGTPANVYEVGVYDDAGTRWDSGYSTTAASFDAGTDTSLSVAVEAGRSLWTTGGTFPFDVNLLGARVRVTAISGASSPQTFTVNATVVNGITKTIPSGTPVRLWAPKRYGL